MTTPDIIDDEFILIDQQCGDATLYSIPNQGTSVANWPNHVERTPPFPNCEALCMNKVITTPIPGWNMSRWIM